MATTQPSIAPEIQRLGGRVDRAHGPPLYRQIADLFREQLRSGALKPGQGVPTQRELASAWSIGEVTIRRAMQQLGAEGLIEARPGVGTVIADRGAAQDAGCGPGTLTLGVAFADLTDGYPFFRPVLRGLRSDGAEVAIRLFDMPEAEQAAGSLAHAPPLSGLDGLVMMSPVNLALLAQSQRAGLPTVLLFSDFSDGFSHCVVPDYARGVIEAVGRLAASGRRRIALVTAGPERFSTGRWAEAYRAAMAAQGLSARPEWIVHAGYAERDGASATRGLLALDPKPEAILYASDFMARGGLLAAHESGLRVPEDVAVVGAGPVLEEGGWTVPLSTIDLGLEQMGRLARQCIEAAREGRSQGPTRHAVASRFEAGETG